MTKPEEVLVWREFADWKPRIMTRMSDVITPAVMENVKVGPPEYCHWDDESWQQKALNKAGIKSQTPLVEMMADRLPQEYDYVRAYHGCRPTDIESYYKSGLLPADPKSLQDLATKYFLNPPRITEETLIRAVQVAEGQFRGGKIYFAFDARILTSSSSHYLEYGSEYLAVIAQELRRMTGENCPGLLKTIGIPTIFACDLPISNMPQSVHHLSGKLMVCLFEEFVRPQWEVPSIDFTITISVKLPPTLIASHYHPE